MEDFPNLPLLPPREALHVLSQSSLTRAQKLLATSLVTQSRVFEHTLPRTGEHLLILDVTHFLNHRINTKLIYAIGEELADAVSLFAPELILTAPSSGNIPSVATAMHLVPMPDVIYAPKGMPITMREVFQAKSRSYTHGKAVDLTVAKDCLLPGTTVAICDDFLDTGRTALDLDSIVRQAQATPVAFFFVIEKPFGGREKLRQAGYFDKQIISLIRIESLRPGKIKLEGLPYWFLLARA